MYILHMCLVNIVKCPTVINFSFKGFRVYLSAAAELLPPSSEEKSDSSKGNLKILQWIFVNMKIKLLEALGNISRFVGDLFKPVDCDKEEQSYAFTEKLKSTFLLTVVVLLIVVVARGHRA